MTPTRMFVLFTAVCVLLVAVAYYTAPDDVLTSQEYLETQPTDAKVYGVVTAAQPGTVELDNKITFTTSLDLTGFLYSKVILTVHSGEVTCCEVF